MKTAKYLLGFAGAAWAISAQAAPFAEGFDDVSALGASGWLQTNTGAAPTQPWFQGNSGVFGSQAGAPDSYVAANFLSSATGAIDNWLISPVLTFDAGSMLSFYTRSAGTQGFADLLEVLVSDGSSNLADFVSLGTIGASSAYPTNWTLYSFALPTSATGRFAFRQGGSVDTADYLGVDTVSVAAVTNIPEPSTYALMALGIAGLTLVRRRRDAP